MGNHSTLIHLSKVRTCPYLGVPNQEGWFESHPAASFLGMVCPSIPVDFLLYIKSSKHQGMLVFLPGLSIPFYPPSSWPLLTYTCISSPPSADSCIIPNLAPRTQTSSFTSLVIHLTSLWSFPPCLPVLFFLQVWHWTISLLSLRLWNLKVLSQGMEGEKQNDVLDILPTFFPPAVERWLRVIQRKELE